MIFIVIRYDIDAVHNLIVRCMIIAKLALKDRTNLPAVWRHGMDKGTIAPSGIGTESRVSVLDGIRGWAALSVAASHIMWGVFGDVEPLFKNLVSGLLLNGLFAVMLFFVLSGEALTASYWRQPGSKPIWKLAVKRYPRLVVPVLAACLLVFILTNLELAKNAEAGIVLGNGWLARFPTEPKSLYQLLSFAFFYVFYRPFIDFSIIPFLWTMRTEAIGSVFVVAFLVVQPLLGNWTKWALVVLAVLMTTAGILTACFAVGMLFGLMRRSNAFSWRRQSIAATALTIIGLVALLLPGSYLMLNDQENVRVLIPVTALFLFLIYSDQNISAFLQNRVSQWLGRISFPVFLVHYAVIISFTSWLVIAAAEAGLLSRPVYLAIALGSLVVSIACGVLFQPAERAAVRFADWIWRRLGNPLYERWDQLFRQRYAP